MNECMRKLLVWLHLDKLLYDKEYRSKNRERYHITPSKSSDKFDFNTEDERMPLLRKVGNPMNFKDGFKVSPLKLNLLNNNNNTTNNNNKKRVSKTQLSAEDLHALRNAWFQLAGRQDVFQVSRRIQQHFRVYRLPVRHFDMWLAFQLFNALDLLLSDVSTLQQFAERCANVGGLLAARAEAHEVSELTCQPHIWDDLALSLAEFVRDSLPHRRLWLRHSHSQTVWLKLFLRTVDCLQRGCREELAGPSPLQEVVAPVAAVLPHFAVDHAVPPALFSFAVGA